MFTDVSVRLLSPRTAIWLPPANQPRIQLKTKAVLCAVRGVCVCERERQENVSDMNENVKRTRNKWELGSVYERASARPQPQFSQIQSSQHEIKTTLKHVPGLNANDLLLSAKRLSFHQNVTFVKISGFSCWISHAKQLHCSEVAHSYLNRLNGDLSCVSLKYQVFSALSQMDKHCRQSLCFI